MSERIVIDGIAPYDGTYDFDASYFTMRELHVIKRIAGVRAGELDDALAASDSDVIVAIAVIALTRAGVQVNEDAIWDAPAGTVLFVGDEAEVEGDAVPPPVALNGSGGGSSTPGSVPLESDLSRIGDQPSDTSAISDLEISAI